MRKIWICGPADEVSNYILALKEAGLDPVAATALPASEGLAAQDFVGLLLPGGGDMDPRLYGQENHGCRTINRQLDLAQLQALDIFVKAKKPVLGICKGHQVINVYFGGTLIQDLPDHSCHEAHDGRDSHHSVRILPDTPPADIWGSCEMTVNSAHHQAVNHAGNGLCVCAYSDDGVIEGLFHKELPILGLQWHPERMSRSGYDTAGMSDGGLIFRYFKEQVLMDCHEIICASFPA
ncbi:MAG: gamma-glutamyl-gamma-aminobutyrate hydrolase family protein [Lachnospiraceae bacterium]|nr:gamma-glutamyl-gamma-aminobutyrate hydrolase family protein [Lachnospiraceae bacterium]